MEKKKIKIVFLCRDFGIVNRGVETHVKELSERLRKKFSVEIFSGKDSDSLEKIIKGKFDLVIPTNGRFQSIKMSFGRLFGHYKILIAAHAGIGIDEILNLLTFPDVYVALTEMHLKWSKKFALGFKLVKIPNGIDLGKFCEKGEKVDFGLTRPVLVDVGTLDWYKHHDLAIKAVSKSNASLLIVGNGPLKNKLENLGNQLLGASRFKIISAQYSQMPALYRNADLFTLPSWDREAFGIVYLEAMASGLAVVAPDDLSRREIIGNSGVFTDVFDTQKYSTAINKALNTNWKNIPRLQAEKFSWDKISEKYEELILKLCQ